MKPGRALKREDLDAPELQELNIALPAAPDEDDF